MYARIAGSKHPIISYRTLDLTKLYYSSVSGPSRVKLYRPSCDLKPP